MKLYGDTETFSATPIQHGTYRYAANAEVMLFPYAIDNGPVQCWDVTTGEPCPRDLAYALSWPEFDVVFHNAMFDRAVLRFAMPQYCPTLDRWHCTMVKALSCSLPGSLDALGEVLGLPQDTRKLKTGNKLIQLFCKPQPEKSKSRRATRETHPGEWEQFIAYAKADVEAMRKIDQQLPNWNYRGFELAMWRLDQQINDRGVCMDIDLARTAIAAVDQEQQRLAAKTKKLTNYDAETGEGVASATQRDALLEHILAEYSFVLPDMRASTIEKFLESGYHGASSDLPEALRELLLVRLQSTTTSTSKYKRVINGVNVDGRLRGLLQFNGASRTGRWSGRTFQPQNLPRPSMTQKDIEYSIDAFKGGVADLLLPDVMAAASSALRGVIVAPKGRKLVVSDLSNIEGRDQAWLAGEDWKLKAFEDFDAGTGHDLYKLAYAKSFGVAPETVTKDQRQKGKVQELALGYQGGVGAFVTFAAGYGIDLDQMAKDAWDSLPDDLRYQALDFWAWCQKENRPTHGLSKEVFVTCDTFKRAWRHAHEAISAYWPQLENAAICAVQNTGQQFAVRELTIERVNHWLRVTLPSGRALCYPRPQVKDNKLSYEGVNQYSRKWCRLSTYGGKLFENVCQAVARDVMVAAMPHIEEAGYSIILTVHDEVICEAPDREEFNAKHLSALLAAGAPWSQGMPLAAGGFEGYRYRKD